MYEYRFDRTANLLDIKWLGVFDPDTAVRYADELRVAFDRAGFQPGYLLRMDMTDSGVQTQPAVRAFRGAFTGFPIALRIAVVTQSAIARLQIRREMTQTYLRVVISPEAALQWLFHGREEWEPHVELAYRPPAISA